MIVLVDANYLTVQYCILMTFSLTQKHFLVGYELFLRKKKGRKHEKRRMNYKKKVIQEMTIFFLYHLQVFIISLLSLCNSKAMYIDCY